MQRITIHKLGPVSHCELDINDFMVVTGPQASGKSTVAKSVYLFKSIKNILFTQIQRQCLIQHEYTEDTVGLSVRNRLIREIRSDFLQIFGSTWCMDESMYLLYEYAEDVTVQISLKSDPISPNYIWIDFSQRLRQFLDSIPVPEQGVCVLDRVKQEIDAVFQDDAEIIYIPAGRSLITLLSAQLNYIYSSMDDLQKRSLDYCTRNYLERILKLKPVFSTGVSQMIRNVMSLTDTRLNKDAVFKAEELMNGILQGEYRNVDGEERLQVSDDRYVKINFASSGQQEAVWILNVLFYYLLHNKGAYFIIEEPESHLFPNAQKLITEFIALSRGNRSQIFITTHSPYVLGTINNLLYADRIAPFVNKRELSGILDRNLWISCRELSAFFMHEGEIKSCKDDEFGSIENEVIDGASDQINEDFDRMVLLREKAARREVE